MESIFLLFYLSSFFSSSDFSSSVFVLIAFDSLPNILMMGRIHKKHYRQPGRGSELTDSNNIGLIKIIFQYIHFHFCFSSTELLYRLFSSTCFECVEKKVFFMSEPHRIWIKLILLQMFSYCFYSSFLITMTTWYLCDCHERSKLVH